MTAFLVAVFLGNIFYQAYSQEVLSKTVSEQSKLGLFARLGAPTVDAPEADVLSVNSAAKFVARSPIHQDGLSLWLYLQRRDAGDTAEFTRLVELMRGLGWRSTPALQNSISAAIEQQDVRPAIESIDGLLRRRKLEDQSFLALQTIETIDEGRPIILSLGTRGNPWLDRYLIDRGFARTEPGRSARMALLSEAGERGIPIEDAVARSNSRGMFEAEDQERAWGIFRSFASNAFEEDPLVFDPDFQTFVARLRADESPWPFEWRKNQSPGLTVSPTQNGVRVRWNGMGNPIILAQRMNFAAQNAGEFYVTFADPADATLGADILRVRLQCLQGNLAGVFKGESVGNRQVRFRWALSERCNFADLQLRGLRSGAFDNNRLRITRFASTRE